MSASVKITVLASFNLCKHKESKFTPRSFGAIIFHGISEDYREYLAIPWNALKSPEILENGLLSRGNLIKYKNETGANVRRRKKQYFSQ